MLPHESKSSSDSETVIKEEAVDGQIDIKLEFKEEPQEKGEEKKDEPDEIKNVDFDMKTVDLKKEEPADGDPNSNTNINTRTNKKANTSTKIRRKKPVPTKPKTKNRNMQKTPCPHPKLKCSICKKKYPTHQKLKKHQLCHNKKFSCTLCDFKGRSVSDLQVHFRIHTKEKPWKCPEPQCQMSFTQKQAAQLHAFSKHGINELNYKVFRCKFCTYQTINKAHHKTHVNNVHKKRKRFKCPSEGCSYACTIKANLTLHRQRLHSHTRPFKCPETKTEAKTETGTGRHYEGKTKQNLKLHLKIFHKKSKEEIEATLEGEICSSPDTAKQNEIQSQMTKTKSKPESPQSSKSQPLVKSSCVSLELEKEQEKGEEKNMHVLQPPPPFLNAPDECTNGNEIEPELVELKYEIKEENWLDESEQDPVINPTAIAASDSTSGPSSCSSQTTRFDNLQAVSINGKAHFINLIPVPVPVRDKKESDSAPDPDLDLNRVRKCDEARVHKVQHQNHRFLCNFCGFKTLKSNILMLHKLVQCTKIPRPGNSGN